MNCLHHVLNSPLQFHVPTVYLRQKHDSRDSPGISSTSDGTNFSHSHSYFLSSSVLFCQLRSQIIKSGRNLSYFPRGGFLDPVISWFHNHLSNGRANKLNPESHPHPHTHPDQKPGTNKTTTTQPKQNKTKQNNALLTLGLQALILISIQRTRQTK